MISWLVRVGNFSERHHSIDYERRHTAVEAVA